MRIMNKNKTLFESFQEKLNEDTASHNITHLLDMYDWKVDLTTNEQLGSDAPYHKLLKSVEDAEKFNYHSDYWGDADAYQEEMVELVETFEPYFDEIVTVDFEDGSQQFKLLGVLVDKQYNDLSHANLLVEEVQKESVKIRNSKLKEAFNFSKNARKNRLVESAAGLAQIIWGKDAKLEDMTDEERKNLEKLDDKIGYYEDIYYAGHTNESGCWDMIKDEITKPEYGLNSDEIENITKFYSKYSNAEPSDDNDEPFTMVNNNTGEEVRVQKDGNGNKWVDSDGNKYMGYLTKAQVKSYFKGNWSEK